MNIAPVFIVSGMFVVGAAEDLPDDAGEGLLELMVGHHIDYGV